MISLKDKGMPNAIQVGGHVFLIETDYRIWLDFPDRVNEAIKQRKKQRYNEIFSDQNNIPPLIDETVEQLKMFYHQEQVVPRDSISTERVIDFNIDADMIFSAFMQTYGIDLTEEDLHWHKFNALLSSIPSDTLLSKIIGYRLYDGNDKDMKDMKYRWALPTEYTEEEKEAKEEFDKFFG